MKPQKRKPQKVKQTKFNTYETQKPDYFDVNGVKYLREDLVNKKMDAIMERIATALETQASFCKKWDGMLEPLKGLMEKIQ